MAECRFTSDYDPYTIDMFSQNRDLTQEAMSPISPSGVTFLLAVVSKAH